MPHWSVTRRKRLGKDAAADMEAFESDHFVYFWWTEFISVRVRPTNDECCSS